jgi:hypothetical protein
MYVTIAGLVLGALGVLAAIVTYLLSRRPKRFGLVLDQWIKLLSEAYPDIEVTHRGIPVANPHFFEIRFKNYGKVEIRPEDFLVDEPLTVTFASAKIIDASVKTLRKGQVHTATTNKENCVEFAPMLVNPGEEVVLAGIASSTEDVERIDVSGRIAGVASIYMLPPNAIWSFLEKPMYIVPFAVLIVALFGYAFVTVSPLALFSAVFLYFLALSPGLVGWWRQRRFRH